MLRYRGSKMYSGSNACGKSTAPGRGITGSCFGKVTDEGMGGSVELEHIRIADWANICHKHNDEIRMTKPESMTNDEARRNALLKFGLRHSFVIRHSGFVIVPIPSDRSCTTESCLSMSVKG